MATPDGTFRSLLSSVKCPLSVQVNESVARRPCPSVGTGNGLLLTSTVYEEMITVFAFPPTVVPQVARLTVVEKATVTARPHRARLA